MLAATIPGRVLDRADREPDRPAWYTRDARGWSPVTWGGYGERVHRAAAGMLALGVRPGSTVAILGGNTPEWTVAAVAAMAIGVAPAGIYTTCSPDEIAHIVLHCRARVLFVENAALYARVAPVRARFPDVTLVALGDEPLPDALSWASLLARGTATRVEIDAYVRALRLADLATLIYTSGTTGPPKGVMLTHGNLAFTAELAAKLVSAGPDDRMLSYLPLSHIAEQMFTIHGPATAGYAIYYARSLEKLREDLIEVHPTIFFGVPRVWEKCHVGVRGRIDGATGLRARIAGWARGVGLRAVETRGRGQPLGTALRVQHSLASSLVFGKVREAMGLDAARICISGAAPIAPDLLRFFASLDLPILEVYGQSEDCGPTSFNLPEALRLGSVGRPVPGVEVKIADDGEILVKGPNVFAGYLHDPEGTAEVLVDGWLHSGDLGSFDADGYLHITGRKKDILITAGGKNIAPRNLEEALKELPWVAEAVVVGDRRPYLVALLQLDPVAVARFADVRGLDPRTAADSPELRAVLAEGVAAINERFARVEGIKRFGLLRAPLSIESGELTPTLKIKRKVVNEHHAALIEALYEDP